MSIPFTNPATPSVTQLLASIRRGDGDARRDLYAHLYPEIKRVARARIALAGGGIDLNTTALVHEGFIRLADAEGLEGRTRGEFFAYVGRVLRSVVIDHIRSEGADKRGSGSVMLTMSAADNEPATATQTVDLIALDRALHAMQKLDAGLYELIEMLHFTGTSVTEVATLRGVSRRTIERDVVKARALLGELMGSPTGEQR